MIVFKDKKRELIQREAFNRWVKSNYKGILNIATGVGKTMLGVMAIQQMLETKPSSKIIIIVPKIDLQEQWIQEITEQLPETKPLIGRVGSGYDEYDKQITICVINSLRDRQDLTADLCIIDEVHRVVSDRNYLPIKNGRFDRIMGLTATLHRNDNKHMRILTLIPLIYVYSVEDALQDNVLTKYQLINIGVELEGAERRKYEELSETIQELLPLFGNNLSEAITCLKTSKNIMIKKEASKLLQAVSLRKAILSNPSNKIRKAKQVIVREYQEGNKILVFSEYKKTAEELRHELELEGVLSKVYHSGYGIKEKQKILEGFRDNDYRVLISVKALDEGTNIPDCNVGVIIAGTGVRRQLIQRLGRIIRKSESKHQARMYQFYVKNTQDEKWLIRRGG